MSPPVAAVTYERLERLGGIQWPCPDEDHPGELFLHGRLWEEDPHLRGDPAPFTVVEQEDPLDELSAEFPPRLTTGRRLDSYNTGLCVAAVTFGTPGSSVIAEDLLVADDFPRHHEESFPRLVILPRYRDSGDARCRALSAAPRG